MTTNTTVLTGAKVLDVRRGEWLDSDVTITNERITSVGPSSKSTPSTQNSDDTVHIVDLSGKYLVPGFIDGHVHVTAFSAEFRNLTQQTPSYVFARASQIMSGMLDRGFTSVRDMGGADVGLAQAQTEGLLKAPRIFYCGHAISQTGGHADMRLAAEDHDPSDRCGCDVGVVADGIDAVRKAARDEIRKGAHHLKIMASGGVSSPTDRVDSTQYAEDEIEAIVAEASAANRYVAAHAYTARAINRAILAGVRSIEHGNILDDESLELLKAHDTYLVPTLVTYWALKNEGRESGLSQSSWEKVDSVLSTGLEAIRRAHEAGVTLVYGSDLLGDMHRHQNEEFRILSEVQPAIDAIRAATVNAAALLEREGELGEIVDGAFADILVLDSDPLADIGVIADPADHLLAVIQNGVVASGDLGVDS